MENEYPDDVINACKIFPGSTHIMYEYRWINKYTGATYEQLPANTKMNEYKAQRHIVLTAITSWEDITS